MTQPAAVGRIDCRADEDERANAFGVPLRQSEDDLTTEGVGDEDRRALVRSGEAREDVGEPVDRRRSTRPLARPPAGKVRDRDAERTGERSPERLEVPAGHAQPVNEDDRVAGASLAYVEAVAASVAPTGLQDRHDAVVPVRPGRRLGGVIDHVTIRVADLDRTRAFYILALRLLDGPEPFESDGFLEWHHFSIARATDERPPTHRLHVAFTAARREQVDGWWRALRDAGHPDLGRPGPRPEYSPTYYGAFVADPAGNSIEAVHHDHLRSDGGTIDHLWLRVTELEASTRFYATVAPTVGAELLRWRADRTTVRRDGPPSFTLVAGEPTGNLHLAFAAPDAATVEAFHRAGVEAGYASLGAPGERPQCHRGYFGAYLADPDGHVVEAVFHDRTAV